MKFRKRRWMPCRRLRPRLSTWGAQCLIVSLALGCRTLEARAPADRTGQSWADGPGRSLAAEAGKGASGGDVSLPFWPQRVP